MNGGVLRDRFEHPLNPEVQRFLSSVVADARLVPFDLEGSRAHARMLARVGLLDAQEAGKILSGLDQIQADWQAGRWKLDPLREDVHLNVEGRLEELIGPVARKLHTGRSRNDQVALDLRLYARSEGAAILQALEALQQSLQRKALEYATTAVAAYTHLQPAQPIFFGKILDGYRAALGRDRERFEQLLGRVNVSPLGAGAVAGSTLPLDPAFSAAELGMTVFSNPVDAVADRDFAVEFLFASSLALTHLSQLAEQLIFWATRESGLLELADAVCTTSSMMPQKRNPDVLELVRAKAAVVTGLVGAALGVLKAQPMGYNRDLQELKPLVFQAADETRSCLGVLVPVIEGLLLRQDRAEEAVRNPELLATDLAEYLVRKGVPFRDAHGIVGRIMREQPKELTLELLRSACIEFDQDVLSLLDPASSARRRSQ